jgi:translocator protein
MQPKNIVRLIVSVGVSLLAGAIGSFFTASAIPAWYAGLVKPSFNPPNWLFGPVWTLLYVLMGISLYLVWGKAIKNNRKKAAARNAAIMFFFIQLALNALWSILFFGLKMPWLAFFEIILLWSAILAAIIFSYRISKPAAYLLVPYILWVSFASALNFAIWMLN